MLGIELGWRGRHVEGADKNKVFDQNDVNHMGMVIDVRVVSEVSAGLALSYAARAKAEKERKIANGIPAGKLVKFQDRY